MADELPLSPLQQEYTDQALLDMKNLLARNPYVNCFKNANKHYYKLGQGGRRPNKKIQSSNEDDGAVAGDYCLDADRSYTLTDEMEASITDWIVEVQDTIPSCFNYKKKQLTTCKCFFLLDVVETTKILSFLAVTTKGMRQTLYKQFLIGSKSKKQAVIKLPFMVSKHVVCSTTFCNLFSIREEQFTRLAKELKEGNPGANVKRTINNTNRQKTAAITICKESVVKWITQFADEHEEPTATHFI